MSEEIARYGAPGPDPDQEAAEALKRIFNTVFLESSDGSLAVNPDLLGHPRPDAARLVNAVNKRLIQDMKILRSWFRRLDI